MRHRYERFRYRGRFARRASGRHSAHLSSDSLQRILKCIGISSATLSHIWLAAATPTKDFCSSPDKVSGLDAALPGTLVGSHHQKGSVTHGGPQSNNHGFAITQAVAHIQHHVPNRISTRYCSEVGFCNPNCPYTGCALCNVRSFWTVRVGSAAQQDHAQWTSPCQEG